MIRGIVYMKNNKFFISYKILFLVNLMSTIHSAEMIKGVVAGTLAFVTSRDADKQIPTTEDIRQKYNRLMNEMDEVNIQKLCDDQISFYKYKLQDNPDEKDLWNKPLSEWIYQKELGTLHIKVAKDFILKCKNEIEQKDNALRILDEERVRASNTKIIDDRRLKTSEEKNNREWQIQNIKRIIKNFYPFSIQGPIFQRAVKSTSRKFSRLAEEGAFNEQLPDFLRFRIYDRYDDYNEAVNGICCFSIHFQIDNQNLLTIPEDKTIAQIQAPPQGSNQSDPSPVTGTQNQKKKK